MSDFGFTLDPQMVRVDLFKPNSMKFYTTISLNFDRYFEVIPESEYKKTGQPKYEHINDTFLRCLRSQFPNFINSGFLAVCLEPYHKNSYPLMIKL